MKKITVNLTPETARNPQEIADFVQRGDMSAEEAVCTVAAIMYGPSLRGVCKAVNFKQYWGAQLSGSQFKDTLLEHADPKHKDMIVSQIEREEQEISQHTKHTLTVIQEKLPDLWAVIKDSDFIWEMPFNVEKLSLDAPKQTGNERSVGFALGGDPKPLDGRLEWGGEDVDYVEFLVR